MCVYVCKAHVRFLRVCGRQTVSGGEVNERVRQLHVAALLAQTRDKVPDCGSGARDDSP